jgi:hypothetical protein
MTAATNRSEGLVWLNLAQNVRLGKQISPHCDLMPAQLFFTHNSKIHFSD